MELVIAYIYTWGNQLGTYITDIRASLLLLASVLLFESFIKQENTYKILFEVSMNIFRCSFTYFFNINLKCKCRIQFSVSLKSLNKSNYIFLLRLCTIRYLNNFVNYKLNLRKYSRSIITSNVLQFLFLSFAISYRPQ